MTPESSSLDVTDLQRQPDEDVLVALQGGHLPALEILYDRYAKPIYSLAYHILGNMEEAEDLTQEVFLALWQKDLYQRHRGSLKTFLVTLTRSRAIDRLRRQKTRHRFLQRWERLSTSDDHAASPLDSLSIREQSDRLREALAGLSDSERKILEIAYYEGISQSEIAKRLNLPLGTVKTRSRQGLNKLRQRLQSSN